MRERSRRPNRQYAAIPNAAMRDESISIEARGLLALLMTFSDDWEFNREDLMKRTGMKKDRFGKVMGELVAKGYVEIVNIRNEKGHLLGRTWVIRDDATDVRDSRTSVDAPTSEISATDVRQNRRPVKPTSGETAPIRKPKEKKTKREEDLFGSDEPQSPRDALPASEANAEKQDDGFSEFWEAYPKAPRKTDKPKAKASFDRIVAGKAKGIGSVRPETIIAAVKRYAASGPDPEFVPLPTTWLNGARWEQWAEAPKPKLAAYRSPSDWMNEAARRDPCPDHGRFA